MLAGYEKVLGVEHSSTPRSVYCLAYLLHYIKQDDCAVEEPDFSQSDGNLSPRPAFNYILAESSTSEPHSSDGSFVK